MAKSRVVYEFEPLKEAEPGSGLHVYWNYSIRYHGRKIFKDAVQGHKDDMAPDPWESEA